MIRVVRRHRRGTFDLMSIVICKCVNMNRERERETLTGRACRYNSGEVCSRQTERKRDKERKEREKGNCIFR